MDDELGGCLALLLVLGVIVAAFMALIYGGQSVIIAVEFVAHGFTLVGVSHPVVAWSLLGCSVGALVGLARGFQKAGRRSDVAKAYIAAGATVGILLMCSADTVDRTIRTTSAASAAAAAERAAAALQVTNVTTCEGEFSNTNNDPRCRPDKARRHVGVRFDFTGAIPNRTEMTLGWYKNGVSLRSWSVTARAATGWVWHNYESPNSNPLPPGTYEVVLFGGQTERGSGRIVVAAQRPERATPSSTPAAAEAPPRQPAGLGAGEHVRRARALLEAREYKRALAEAEQALRSEPGNEEARALRNQIQGMIRILNP